MKSEMLWDTAAYFRIDPARWTKPLILNSEETGLPSDAARSVKRSPAAVWSLRVGEDRPNGLLDPGAVGPRSGSTPRLGRVANKSTNTLIKRSWQ